MDSESRRIVIAECGDLMLAKDCIASLQLAGFAGEVKLVTLDDGDQAERRSFAVFGDEVGESAGRGMIIGGLLGALVGAGFSAVLDLQLGSLTETVVGLVSGAALGGVGGWNVSKRRGKRRGRFLITCEGSPAEVARAYETLRQSACQQVRLQDVSEA